MDSGYMIKGFLDAYDYYMRHHYSLPAGVPSEGPQHELMAAHYRSIIEAAIKEFNDSFDEEIYEALAWVGLMGSGLVNEETGLPPSPTVVWSQLDQALRITIYNTVKSFKDNNDACQ